MSTSRRTRVRHEFVDAMPEQLDEGVLYVSVNRRIVLHRCFCGCGQEVATPLAPHEWQLEFDGESVSLFPSVGVWGIPCQSHYWVENDRVIWSGRLSRDKIERLRRREREEVEGIGPEHPVPKKDRRSRFWRRRR
ncbi:MAG TPA: DUF6527 family protein [Solirubrobacterales bacterium]